MHKTGTLCKNTPLHPKFMTQKIEVGHSFQQNILCPVVCGRSVTVQRPRHRRSENLKMLVTNVLTGQPTKSPG